MTFKIFNIRVLLSRTKMTLQNIIIARNRENAIQKIVDMYKGQVYLITHFDDETKKRLN